MKGTYRTYRFQVIATLTYETNEFGVLQTASEAWRYRIQSPQNQIIYDSDSADPVDNQPFFRAAVDAAIARINDMIAAGEQPPALDAPGTFI